MTRLSHLRWLEAESIHILRETAAEFQRPVLLYSIGKDSSVLVRLAQKAFHPAAVPFPLLHVDTGYKFGEMIEFRDRFCREQGLDLRVHSSQEYIDAPVDPFRLGTSRCCAQLKTRALLEALRALDADAAIGGARREEEKSRAKERIFSHRDAAGQWDPRNQRPELWNLFNSRLDKGQSMRVFPLSNWTEIDVWEYIEAERIPVVPLYFAKPRPVVVRGGALIPLEHDLELLAGEHVEERVCRMRSLGCTYCTGAVESTATTVPEIIAELQATRHSERQNRAIDHDQEGSMELKKREGYF
ncbi:sulfate adenylyltransferase subunit CysD [Paludibaculum fermentans]|uniref:Sulfate adenylyltransferase subunit 2 n=1 Tax=Paludibaculum fermentans TaxID=1473598 RepID=A0A7S7SIJ0_PALFE|nr:sulfate adenylyltransferase subunit CysD [Paludibaculum fermentans]QOY84985.1 sulfate adenylyltransferase subunit CysD [Paludibaculum fermentans]